MRRPKSRLQFTADAATHVRAAAAALEAIDLDDAPLPQRTLLASAAAVTNALCVLLEETVLSEEPPRIRLDRRGTART